MPKIDFEYSSRAGPIEAALSEGRTEDACRQIVKLLRTGDVDDVILRMAADMLDPPAKRRGRPKAHLPMHWLKIAEEFYRQRRNMKYEAALLATKERLGMSETHIRNCVCEYDEAKAASDAETDVQMEQLHRK